MATTQNNGYNSFGFIGKHSMTLLTVEKNDNTKIIKQHFGKFFGKFDNNNKKKCQNFSGFPETAPRTFTIKQVFAP